MSIRTMLLPGLLSTALCVGAAFASEQATEREATIKRAIELHDAGSYDAAIRVYQSLLEEDPNDGLVLYEIAMSYESLKDYENCITYAARSSRIESEAQPAAFAMIANCQDDSGRADEALKTFAKAVRRFPKSVMLNYNYAVTLLRNQAPRKARDALRVAIEEAPGYPSPYRLYASMLDGQGHTAAALLMYLRFIMADPGSDRAIDAAAYVLESFAGALSEEGADKEIRITMPDPNAKDTEGVGFEKLNVALALVGAAPRVSDDGTPLEAPERLGLAMKLFLIIATDTADRKLQKSFVWQTAAVPLLELQEREVLETFLYHVAALGRVEGAAQRLHAQPEAVDKLAQVMAELSEQWQRKAN